MTKRMLVSFMYLSDFNKNVFLKAFQFLLIISLFTCLPSHKLNAQSTIVSVNDGSWTSAATWQGETIPIAANNVTVNNTDTIKAGTTAEVYDLIISATGKLVVEGTLIVNGNLEMEDRGNDPSEFILAPNSVTVVRNNVTLSTKVDLSLSSYFIVLRDLDAQSAGTNTHININEASIYIFGNVSDKTDLESCDIYDGLTEDNSEVCHVGTDSAYYNNIDSIPIEIIEIVDGCNTPTATISGNNDPICFGQNIEFYLSGTNDAIVTYNFNGSNNATIDLVNGLATLTISNTTTTQTLNLVSVSHGSCSKSLSESSTVTVNKFNMVVSDETPTPSGEHCPEFGGPFNANSGSYNPGVTEVIFKVEKEFSTTSSWTFDFAIDETGDAEVNDLVVSGNNSAINYSGDNATGSIDATDNTEATFTFKIWNVPGTALYADFLVSNGNDGDCNETSSTNDNSKTHVINVMPVVGSFTP